MSLSSFRQEILRFSDSGIQKKVWAFLSFGLAIYGLAMPDPQPKAKKNTKMARAWGWRSKRGAPPPRPRFWGSTWFNIQVRGARSCHARNLQPFCLAHLAPRVRSIA
jgi:hypothetical protein